ncbi:MAG: hypothetical protein JST19_20630 [Bacteroidetes bacterium]|nr:hypothetical protein [Bacteroidota bacterium]
MPINRKARVLFLIVGGFLSAGSVHAQRGGDIVLQDEKLNFVPSAFYVSGVSDARAEHSILAQVVYKDEAHSYVTRPEEIDGGTAAGIKAFIDHNLAKNTVLRAVHITVRDLALTETAAGGNRVNGRLTLNFSFGLQKDYGIVHLVDYKTTVSYDRPDDQPNSAATILRKKIEDALAWFNTWINSEADKNILLAKAVEVSFTDFTEKPENDTIYYSVNRPLKWTDFTETQLKDPYDAEIFAGVGYTENIEVEKGVVRLKLALKVDVPKSACFVRPGARNDYALNHEQRHFDIGKIVAERFKHKVQVMKLPPDNYDGPINVQYLETLRELDALQKQYDRETKHGMDTLAQAEWNRKIDKELVADGVKNN